MKYDYYTPGHKYLRKLLFQFEENVARTDFNNADERKKAHQDFNELTHMLRETAKYEKENSHLLIKDQESFVIAQMEAGYKVAEEKEIKLRELLGPETKTSTVTSAEQLIIYQMCVEFVDTYRQLLSFKEQSFVQAIHKHNSSEALRALALQSRSQMSLEQIKAIILNKLVPCVNFFDRIAILKDIKDVAARETFDEVWKIMAEQLKPHQQTIILNHLTKI